MKKAAIIFLFASSVFAQVQLGKNVQIGAGGGTGGNVIASPQFRLFLQPNSGTAAVAQGAAVGQNGVAPMLQGMVNPDLYSNGSGNNGIANALASSDCISAGCFFARPLTSTDTESIPTALNLAHSYTHAQDDLYGRSHNFFWNVGPNDNTTGARDAATNVCFWNDATVNTTATVNRCRPVYITMAVAGIDVGSPWSQGYDTPVEAYFYTRGITQTTDSNTYCYHVGDCMHSYDYLWYRNGSTATSDEAIKGRALHVFEVAAPYGTVTTGGANATTVKSNFTANAGNQGDGYNLVSTSEVMASGLITGETSGSGNLLNSITTSDTHSVSTGYATLSSACGANVRRNAPVSYTCSITVLSGSFSAAANATVCVGDYRYPEQANITATGSGTITVGLTYTHPSGTPIYQGGGCGGKLALGFGLTDPFSTHQFTTYFIAGSQTSTSFDYIAVYNGGQNGKQIIPIPSVTAPIGLGTITRTGNVVTAHAFNSTFPLNNFVAPAGAAIVVSGATPSDLNGTVTGVTAWPSTLSWNQTGANESGSGGTISVTGYNNYSIACGAETVAVLGVTLGNGPTKPNSPNLDGTLQLAPNNCAWTPGSAVTQANHYASHVTGDELAAGGFTPPSSAPNYGRTTTLSGMAESAAIENLSNTIDPWSAMQGGGGTIRPRTYLQADNFYGTMFNLSYAPVNGGGVFSIGCGPEGCNSNSYTYGLFGNSYNGGVRRFTFAPSTGLYNIDTLTIGGKLPCLADGTNCPASSSLPSGTANQMLYYAAPGTTVTPLTLGTNLSITAGVLNASSTAATNFNALTSGTNTTAAMLVGSGASLGVTGTGTIAATTAAALASTPTLCSTGQAPTGILANGNATGCAAIGGSGNTTSTSLVTNTLPKANGPASLINSAVSDDGTTVTSTEPIAAPGFKGTGTTPSMFSLPAGTGNIATLPANSGGFAAPVTGGTAYLLKLPATITAGILHAATPATGDGVNESVLTSSAVSLTADVTGLLPNANLANASTTVNGTVCTLGSTCAPTAAAGASAFTTLTDGTPITWAAGAVALANASVTLVHTTSTRAINITGMTSGTNGVLVIKQDSTGGAALTLGTGCTWYIGGSTGFVASTTLSLTTTASAINILAFTYDGTNCYGNLR